MSAPVDQQELESFVRKQLPYYSVPERWMRVNDVPLNANGKVDKARLKELAAELSLPRPDIEPVKPTLEKSDSAFVT
jgi:acyl-CoA synthetase (AMP-forming)/AMP-acid ligase II